MLEQAGISINNQMCIMEDSAAMFNIEELSALPESSFTTLEHWRGEALPEKVFWGKVTIENRDIERSHWLLKTGGGDFIHVYFFDSLSNKFQVKKAGRFVPFSQKDFPDSKDPTIQFHLPKGSSKTLYFKWDNRTFHSPHNFNISVIRPHEWYNYQNKRDVIQSVFQGIMLIMFLYNMALFFTTKDIIYLYYSAYIFCGDLYYLYYFGYAQALFYPESPEVNNLIYIIGPNLASILYFQFLRCFSNTHYLISKWDKFFVFYIWLKALIGISLLGVLWLAHSYSLIQTLMRSVYLFEEGLIVVVMVVLYSTGDKLSRYFVAGTFFLAAGIIFGILSNWIFGISPFYYAIFNEIGIVAEIFCFSLGLGYRIRLNEEERRKVQGELIAQLRVTEEIQGKQNEELEVKVQERIQEIEQQKEQIEHTHAEMELQNQKLRFLNEEKNNLVRIVAHDLKSPLSRILGLINVIRLDAANLKDVQVEYMGMIEDAVQSLQQMISRILNVDSLGKVEQLEVIDVDLVSYLNGMHDQFLEQAVSKEINLVFVHNQDQLAIKTDKNYLDSVLENLISNALKFSSPETQVVITLQMIDANKVKISIKDEGPGFSDEDKKKLFRKYQRLSAKPTGGENSTGLGLSIVKKYVNLLQGHIYVESVYGEGATFHVLLPITIQEKTEIQENNILK